MMVNERDVDPKIIIRDGYNTAATRYEDWSRYTRLAERRKYTDIVISKCPQGSHVLDLGCGTGLPTTLLLSENFNVTAVDISDSNIKLATRNVPNATFIRSDMAEVKFLSATFDCITAFYSLIHIPFHEQESMYGKIFNWLRPGGLFIATLGSDIQELYKENWLGVHMYWGEFKNNLTIQFIENAEFEIDSISKEMEMEDGKPISFLWIAARKPKR